MDGKIEKRLTEYGKFHKGDGGGGGVSPDLQKNLTEKSRLS